MVDHRTRFQRRTGLPPVAKWKMGCDCTPVSCREINTMSNPDEALRHKNHLDLCWRCLSEPSATAAATAAFTGLRLGELRDLTSESFEPAQDEESLGWLNVTQSVLGNTVGDPKNSKIHSAD
jgi:hypothetical protein